MNQPPSSSPQDDSEGPSLDSNAIILFDGVCNLCNGFVNFVFDHDPAGYFKVGSLQSTPAKEYLNRFGENPGTINTIVLIEDGHLYRRSTAALRIFRRLAAPWPFLYVFIVVPRPLRDWIYDVVAANRYDWFGQREQCRMPTPEQQDRFVE